MYLHLLSKCLTYLILVLWLKKRDCYSEIYRVLKPGHCFAAYEWCITDYFDPMNQEHQRIKVMPCAVMMFLIVLLGTIYNLSNKLTYEHRLKLSWAMDFLTSDQ